MRRFIFIVMIIFNCSLYGDVLLLKSADGSIIPGLALSWQEKDGGVLFNIDEKVNISLLKKNVSELFPDMRVDIMGQNLFFSSIKLDTLLPLISGIDVDIQIEDSPFSVKDTYGTIRAYISEKEMIESFSVAKVVSVDIDEKNMKVRFFLDIQISCESCLFPKLKGKKIAFLTFSGKENFFPYDENKNKADALIARPESLVFVSFTKKNDDGSYEIGELYMK